MARTFHDLEVLLAPAQLRVLVEICRQCDQCGVAIEKRVAESLGVFPNAVAQHVRSLIKKGFVSKGERGKAGTLRPLFRIELFGGEG